MKILVFVFVCIMKLLKIGILFFLYLLILVLDLINVIVNKEMLVRKFYVKLLLV